MNLANHEFGGILYRTEADMYFSIAQQWITGCGTATRDDVRQAFMKQTDEMIADDAIQDWNLADPPERDWLDELTNEPEQKSEFCRAALVRAMAELRNR